MSSAVVHTSSFDSRYQEVPSWNIKLLVAALENASLNEILQLMRIQPIKWNSSTRRGRLNIELARSMTRTRVDGDKEEVSGFDRGVPNIGNIEGLLESASDDEQIKSLLETTLKLKVINRVNDLTDEQIEINLAPRALRDHLEELTGRFQSCFYLVNLGRVIDKYLLWRRSIPRIMPFYAVKSNPDIEICRTLHILGTGFDCASKNELELILSLPNIDPQDIIFANPCKQVEHILYAKEHGVRMMTFDNPFELDKIFNHYPDAQLVLRLLPDDSMSLMPFGFKFGASLAESLILIEKCHNLGMELIGVSFHVGSGCFSPVAWVEALKLSRSIFDEAAKFGYIMDLVDIGGGFPGSDNDNISLESIGKAINLTVDSLFPSYVRIISEPGRFFCTESCSLACNIVSKRERSTNGAGAIEDDREIHYYLSDGVYGSMNCIVFDHVILEPLLLSSDADSRPNFKTTMWGPTCDSLDVLCKNIQFPQSDIGEWVYFKNMGAYTSAAASKFNGFCPPPNVYTLNVISDF